MSEAIPGSIIQIDPEHDATFGGCLAVVEKVKHWGVSLCYVKIPGEGVAYYRVPHGSYVVVGQAAWAHAATGGDNAEE